MDTSIRLSLRHVGGRFWICEWPEFQPGGLFRPVPGGWVLAPFHKSWSLLNFPVVSFGNGLPSEQLFMRLRGGGTRPLRYIAGMAKTPI
jgi:hypothetical protein